MDYTELVFRPGLVHDMLTLDAEAKHSSEEDTPVPPCGPSEGSFFYKSRGPTPLQTKYSRMLEEIVSFVQLHGFAAHERRRTGTATSCGVRLEDVRQHLLNNVEGLDKISKTKVYYLMQPANMHSRESARHKDAVDVRVGVKNCDISKENPKAHEYFATIANLRHMCSIIPC